MRGHNPPYRRQRQVLSLSLDAGGRFTRSGFPARHVPSWAWFNRALRVRVFKSPLSTPPDTSSTNIPPCHGTHTCLRRLSCQLQSQLTGSATRTHRRRGDKPDARDRPPPVLPVPLAADVRVL